jgi:hypothetical protein
MRCKAQVSGGLRHIRNAPKEQQKPQRRQAPRTMARAGLCLAWQMWPGWASKKRWVGLYAAFSFVILGYIVSPVFADPLKSNNFQFQETSLGGTGLYDSQSANYQTAGTAGGILGVGNSASSGFQINAGNITTNDPSLSFGITSANANFTDFSPALASTATSTFEVIDYTSYGYIVQVIGTPPTKGSHAITAMSSTGTSQAGTEQFGLNLVANTSPISYGANPDHGQFGFGSAATNYGLANNFRFVSGETIASAPKSSGKTIYTISYLVNVNSLTPGGQYTSSQTLICTGTY